MRQDGPLEIFSDDHEITIRIGVNTLATALSHSTKLDLVDNVELARSIVAVLTAPDEEGTTPVERLFDEAGETVADYGWDGFDYNSITNWD